jgi:hypothetical protein
MFQFLLGVLIFSSNLVLILWAITRANISLSSGVTLAALALPFMLMLPVTASAQNAYITNNGGNTVSVIDTAIKYRLRHDPSWFASLWRHRHA